MAKKTLSGTLLDETVTLTLGEVSRACSNREQWVIELVEEGIIEPINRQSDDWHFYGDSVPKAQIAQRLQRDLHVNLAGVALVLELMDEVRKLRTRLASQERYDE